jgi:hypothetical protein
MQFDPAVYGEKTAQVLELMEHGQRLMPLVAGGSCSPQASRLLAGATPAEWFPGAAAPKAAMAGLWLYLSCFEEAHEIAQDDHSQEGSLWHAILHRQEPDSGNSAYWYRKAGAHPIFPALVEETTDIIRRYPGAEFRPTVKWDPFGFILFVERARQQPGSSSEMAALEIQRAEWQLLFDYCARPRH